MYLVTNILLSVIEHCRRLDAASLDARDPVERENSCGGFENEKAGLILSIRSITLLIFFSLRIIFLGLISSWVIMALSLLESMWVTKSSSHSFISTRNGLVKWILSEPPSMFPKPRKLQPCPLPDSLLIVASKSISFAVRSGELLFLLLDMPQISSSSRAAGHNVSTFSCSNMYCVIHRA